MRSLPSSMCFFNYFLIVSIFLKIFWCAVLGLIWKETYSQSTIHANIHPQDPPPLTPFSPRPEAPGFISCVMFFVNVFVLSGSHPARVIMGHSDCNQPNIMLIYSNLIDPNSFRAGSLGGCFYLNRRTYPRWGA